MSDTCESLREKKERARFDTLIALYDIFLKGIGEKYRKSIYLNKELLLCVVRSYFDDIYRFKDYSGSTYADNHKQAGYSIKWISRFKPIQIKEEAQVDYIVLTANSSFAIFVGFSFLDPEVAKSISGHFFDHLIYTTMYRELDGKSLASLLYVLECSAKKIIP